MVAVILTTYLLSKTILLVKLVFIDKYHFNTARIMNSSQIIRIQKLSCTKYFNSMPTRQKIFKKKFYMGIEIKTIRLQKDTIMFVYIVQLYIDQKIVRENIINKYQ